MGIFRVPLRIAARDNGHFETVDALVDTGATHSIIPAELLHRLGVQPEHTIRLRLADGGLIERPVGTAKFSAAAVTGETPMMSAPVVFGNAGQYLLGMTTLENLGLAVDPAEQTLIISYGYGR